MFSTIVAIIATCLALVVVEELRWQRRKNRDAEEAARLDVLWRGELKEQGREPPINAPKCVCTYQYEDSTKPMVWKRNKSGAPWPPGWWVCPFCKCSAEPGSPEYPFPIRPSDTKDGAA